MKTSYKLWYVRRDDDVHISECAVRFYEGEIRQPELETKPRYIRSRQLLKKDLPHHKDRETINDSNNTEHIVFTDKDFGVISTEEELFAFLNTELSKDKKREPIDEQKI